MPQPYRLDSLETFEDEKSYTLEVAREHGLQLGLLVRPGCDIGKTEKNLDEHPEIKVLKPYMNYSVTGNPIESDILDFAPEWMWSIAHDREMPIMIHLSHYQNMLSDLKNVEQLRYLSRKYSKSKIILAHCAMGHHVHKLKLGLKQICDLENIWFDCSGAAEAMSIYYCIKMFGVDRMMYGGDYDHAEKVGRICSVGSNFLGLHEGYLKEDTLPGDYKYQPLNNAQECLLALLQACEILELSKHDMEKIFYYNAVKLFS